MLQPLQLKDVSVRYMKEIAELRDFLVKANCAVGTVETLGWITARLQRDRAFRRDLISHVWVVIHRCDREISYSDLLGMLAIAAAGTSFAAAADEDDAHNLLRFLMEACRSLDTVPDDRDGAPVRWTAEPAANPSAFQSAGDDGQKVFGGPVQLLRRELHSLRVPQNICGGRRRVHWVVAAACVIVPLIIGLWLRPRSGADVGITPASVTPAAAGNVASSAVTERSVSPSIARPSEAVATAVVHSPSAPRNWRVMPFSPTARNSRKTPVTAPSVPPRVKDVPPQATGTAMHTPVSAQAMEAIAIPASTVRPSASSAAPPPALCAAGTASTAAVGPPAATSSGRLGTPSILLDPSEQGRYSPAARTSKPPILLRRRPPASSSAVPEDGATFVSEVRPADVPATRGTSRTGSAEATRGGIIHLTSLGTMAANIMYSPMPTYPAAAAASHVQGEVKVRADVDRDGNVASVRVISGPPLLRDAALDAVQRWRYRPYISSGRPTPMTAVAIMDFQLP